MRIFIEGAPSAAAAQIANALAAGGFEVADEAASVDMRMTVVAVRPAIFRSGDLLIDLDRRRVERRGQPIWLTPIEFALVAYLLRAARPVGRDELLRALWGYAFDPETNLVAVHISRLRRKLGKGVIVTLPTGYVVRPADA